MTPAAADRLWEHTRGSPLYARAVLRELPADDSWQHEPRPLPVPQSYAQLVGRRLERCDSDVVAVIEAAAVLGVRARLQAVVELACVEDPLASLDAAVESGFVRLDDRTTGAFVEFSHPLARGAIYEAMPNARRCALNGAAAGIVRDAVAAMRHRVEAATITNDALLADLEAHAHDEMSRGAWSSAVSGLIAASRLTPVPADRERLALEAIEAMLYSGGGAAARRLADQTGFADGPRRDSVLAYLAMFAGDLEAAQRLLTRAWERRRAVDDARLAATIAQRSAFLATARLRGREAIEWAQRAMALAPGDPATGLLVAPSLALGFSFIGSRAEAHAALDRWLEDPVSPPRASGFVVLALKGFLLLGEGDVRAGRAAFETSAAREPRARPARGRRAVALGADAGGVPRRRVGQRRGGRRARDRPGRRVGGSLGRCPGALGGEPRAVCSRRLGGRRSSCERHTGASAHVRAARRRRGDRDRGARRGTGPARRGSAGAGAARAHGAA